MPGCFRPIFSLWWTLAQTLRCACSINSYRCMIRCFHPRLVLRCKIEPFWMRDYPEAFLSYVHLPPLGMEICYWSVEDSGFCPGHLISCSHFQCSTHLCLLRVVIVGGKGICRMWSHREWSNLDATTYGHVTWSQLLSLLENLFSLLWKGGFRFRRFL